MMNSRIKIMYLVLDMDLGGLQRVVNLLIRKIDREQFMPYLCCLDRGGIYYESAAAATSSSYKLMKHPGPFDYVMFRKLLNILKENGIDIIHSHNGCSMYAALAKGSCCVKKVIHTDHGRLVPDKRTAILEDRISSVMIDRFVGVSGALTRYLSEIVKVRTSILTTIVNGVDTDKFMPMSDRERRERKQELGLKKNEKIIGTVCRLDPIKNLNMLIEIAVPLVKSIPDCKVLIVGDGPEEAALKNKVTNLNLSSSVIFTGRIANVEKIMPVFDVYVNTSLSEGTSMTILEAMACGIPVVATAVGGNVELVNRTNGILVPAGRVDMFQSELKELLLRQDELEIMAKENRDKVERQFSIDRMVDDYESLYRKVMNGR